ncbi:MAG: hypothetical protein ACO38D_09325, partial [Ilumatobacteraceae bacterium]
VHLRRAEARMWSISEPEVDVVLHDDDSFLATEWEWDDRPEVSVITVSDADETVVLFNGHSPKFVLSILTEDPTNSNGCTGRRRPPS